MNIFVPSAKLVVLKELPFSDYAFPRWQSYASIALVALLSAISATLAPQMHGLPQMSFWVLLGSNFLSTWVLCLMAMFILRWWMKRGDRWDGEGDMFNLIAASWLVIDLIVYAASILGAPGFIVMPLSIYTIWVAGNALSGAIPKASLGYSIGGVILAIIPGALIGAAVGIMLVKMGYLPMPAAPAG